jgi:hypothetical protein
MSVHHVDMNAVRSGTFGLRNLIAQTGEIGCEDRRSELYGVGRHVALLSLR